MTVADRPLPPDPANGTPCDWGGDNSPSAGWRWAKALKQWLPVCGRHSGGSKAFKAGDYVPDWAMVERAGRAAMTRAGLRGIENTVDHVGNSGHTDGNNQ